VKKPDPIRLAVPATAPATVQVRTPVSFKREPAIFKPLDDDQYDIPAFLRKGSRE
jgi:cell division protein FtsZ